MNYIRTTSRFIHLYRYIWSHRFYHVLHRTGCGLAAWFAISVVAGCQSQPITATTTSTKVGYKAISPENAARYTLAPGESATQPSLLLRRDPDYPTELLAATTTSIEVMARLVVAAHGHVSDVLIQPDLGKNFSRNPFNEAVRKAALQWTFMPLSMTRWVERPGISRTLETTKEPCSLWYLFRFEIVAGRPYFSVKQS